LLYFFISSYVHHLALPSFPTRRSSDLDFDGALYLDNTLLAQEGSPSPVSGRNWRSLGSAVVALNDAGQWAMRAQLDGDTSSDIRSEEHTSELQSRENLVCRLLLEKKKK